MQLLTMLVTLTLTLMIKLMMSALGKATAGLLQTFVFFCHPDAAREAQGNASGEV